MKYISYVLISLYNEMVLRKLDFIIVDQYRPKCNCQTAFRVDHHPPPPYKIS